MDQEKLGLFSQPGSIYIGDAYGAKERATAALVEANDPTVTRDRGKQFKTNPSKRGKTADVTFSKFTTLYLGDKYVTQHELDRKYELEKKTRQVVPQPFKPSSPPKKSSGPGSYAGTMGPVWANQKTTDMTPLKPSDIEHAKKNILTSPAKRGTYGFTGLNLGYAAGATAQGVVGEYKYYPETAEGRASTAPTEAVKPWRPNSPARRGTYGVNDRGLFGQYKYEPDPYKNPTAPFARTSKGEKPFRPSHPPRRGAAHGTINSFPTYLGDPEKEKFDRERAERKAARERLLGPVFKPTSVPKSMRVVSITNHPMNYK
mmetsp:Transcript_28995/g.67186  ORF Transcript_28995/g.67186 Transcript_28995/m.67186 type:complete len:316 (+) Transcript_28995:70-1017(+)|eukprot:CAMPEP_0114539778 /NCGR_PEP_ID=MMETSP0114-20121206/420_1 /TAXON_ID=31324 /ORGANISM="Goniomonas sp, Strain m" /LENGTH=315 /DNA_ID=CAMNT_0001723905 /DNA_START=164 /DNA_END=1111 /DNA_ORIENTATION=+